MELFMIVTFLSQNLATLGIKDLPLIILHARPCMSRPSSTPRQTMRLVVTQFYHCRATPIKVDIPENGTKLEQEMKGDFDPFKSRKLEHPVSYVEQPFV
jgi:hypothetical protein